MKKKERKPVLFEQSHQKSQAATRDKASSQRGEGLHRKSKEGRAIRELVLRTGAKKKRNRACAFMSNPESMQM